MATLEDENMPTDVINTLAYDLCTVKAGPCEHGRPPIKLSVNINGQMVQMEMDTGMGRSILNMDTFKKIKNASLRPSDVVLRTYTGEVIPVAGNASVQVNYEKQLQELSVLVVNTSGPNTFDGDWLTSLKLNWQ